MTKNLQNKEFASIDPAEYNQNQVTIKNQYTFSLPLSACQNGYNQLQEDLHKLIENFYKRICF